MTNFKLVHNQTLPEAIAGQIVAQIASGELKPGDRLPTEPELMQQFGVSRSTLREALKSLTMAGLIETRRGAGTFVSETFTGFLRDRLTWGVLFSERELRDIIEVRCGLEGQTAALASERATPEQLQHLRELLATLEAEGQDPEVATDADTAFHVSIAEASQNPLLLNLILSIRHLIRDYIKMGYSDRSRPDTTAGDHRRILGAIEQRRPDEARQAMLDHLNSSAVWMLSIANRRSRPGDGAPASGTIEHL